MCEDSLIDEKRIIAYENWEERMKCANKGCISCATQTAEEDWKVAEDHLNTMNSSPKPAPKQKP